VHRKHTHESTKKLKISYRKKNSYRKTIIDIVERNVKQNSEQVLLLLLLLLPLSIGEIHVTKSELSATAGAGLLRAKCPSCCQFNSVKALKSSQRLYKTKLEDLDATTLWNYFAEI